jgi:hypothetical protein
MPKFYQEKRLKPLHIQLIRLRWMGYDTADIAAKTGYTPDQINRILKDQDALNVFSDLQAQVLDTSGEVIQALQLDAIIAQKRISDLMFSGDDRVALMASKDVLDRAGFVPIKRIAVTTATRVEKDYDGLNDAQIKQKLLEDLTADEDVPAGTIIN